MKLARLLASILFCIASVGAQCVSAQSAELVVPSQTAAAVVAPAKPATREPDIFYLPTPQDVVDAMLKLAGVSKNDVVYDLGCGDGRIVITAAKMGARGVGIDIDPKRVEEATANARAAGVDSRVRIVQADLFEADIGDATVVTLYLLSSLNQKLRPKLLADLKPGTRVVSHAFDMGDWKPEETRNVGGTQIFLWRVPPKKS